MRNTKELYDSMNNFSKQNGMTYRIIMPGEIEYSFIPNENHLATKDLVHGGIISAYMDSIISVAALSTVCEEGKLINTVEFKMNFIRPAKAGHLLIGKGLILSKGKSLLIGRGEIYNKTNDLIAFGIGTMKAYFPLY